jgi:hypothetical protein
MRFSVRPMQTQRHLAHLCSFVGLEGRNLARMIAGRATSSRHEFGASGAAAESAIKPQLPWLPSRHGDSWTKIATFL